jgi:hypothetical protein
MSNPESDEVFDIPFPELRPLTPAIQKYVDDIESYFDRIVCGPGLPDRVLNAHIEHHPFLEDEE